jgi:hypothetical protein
MGLERHGVQKGHFLCVWLIWGLDSVHLNNAVKWTKLSCRRFKDNAARLHLFALAYNLANFLRQLALPKPIQGWTLTTLREKLIKIGAKVVAHSKYVIFQLAELAVPRQLFAAILERIGRLRLACASG